MLVFLTHTDWMLKHTLNAQTNNKENTSEVQTPSSSSSASGQTQPQPSQPQPQQQPHYRKTKRAMSEQQQSMSFARQRQLQRPDQLGELPQDEEAVRHLQLSYFAHVVVVVSN